MDADAFVFLIRINSKTQQRFNNEFDFKKELPLIFKPCLTSKAVYMKNNIGPCFGEGHDISLDDESLKVNSLAMETFFFLVFGTHSDKMYVKNCWQNKKVSFCWNYTYFPNTFTKWVKKNGKKKELKGNYHTLLNGNNLGSDEFYLNDYEVFQVVFLWMYTI